MSRTPLFTIASFINSCLEYPQAARAGHLSGSLTSYSTCPPRTEQTHRELAFPWYLFSCNQLLLAHLCPLAPLDLGSRSTELALLSDFGEAGTIPFLALLTTPARYVPVSLENLASALSLS